jgi:hypothetical protein
MRHAMPEATVLYSVTAAVVAGLVLWVVAVLKTAKEPWAREVVEIVTTPAEPVAATPEASAVIATEPSTSESSGAKLDADSTARATPVAIASEAKAKAAAEAESDAKKADESDGSAKAEA